MNTAVSVSKNINSVSDCNSGSCGALLLLSEPVFLTVLSVPHSFLFAVRAHFTRCPLCLFVSCAGLMRGHGPTLVLMCNLCLVPYGLLRVCSLHCAVLQALDYAVCLQIKTRSVCHGVVLLRIVCCRPRFSLVCRCARRLNVLATSVLAWCRVGLCGFGWACVRL